MEIYAISNSLSNKISIIASEPLSVATFSIYHNNEGVELIPEPIFVPMMTSLGIRYVFEFTPIDVTETSELDTFPGYFFNFQINDELPFGVVVRGNIDCCISKKLEAALPNCNNCNTALSQDFYKADALFTGLEHAVRARNFTLAACVADMLTSICESCCGE